MNTRFIREKRKWNTVRTLVTVLVFCAAIVLFLCGMSTLRTKTDTQAGETLSQAIERGIARCYALEGAYPESLDDLKERYGLVFDESRFYVDYRAQGKNLLPVVTILDREAWQK